MRTLIYIFTTLTICVSATARIQVDIAITWSEDRLIGPEDLRLSYTERINVSLDTEAVRRPSEARLVCVRQEGVVENDGAWRKVSERTISVTQFELRNEQTDAIKEELGAVIGQVLQLRHDLSIRSFADKHVDSESMEEWPTYRATRPAFAFSKPPGAVGNVAVTVRMNDREHVSVTSVHGNAPAIWMLQDGSNSFAYSPKLARSIGSLLRLVFGEWPSLGTSVMDQRLPTAMSSTLGSGGPEQAGHPDYISEDNTDISLDGKIVLQNHVSIPDDLRDAGAVLRNADASFEKKRDALVFILNKYAPGAKVSTVGALVEAFTGATPTYHASSPGGSSGPQLMTSFLRSARFSITPLEVYGVKHGVILQVLPYAGDDVLARMLRCEYEGTQSRVVEAVVLGDRQKVREHAARISERSAFERNLKRVVTLDLHTTSIAEALAMLARIADIDILLETTPLAERAITIEIDSLTVFESVIAIAEQAGLVAYVADGKVHVGAPVLDAYVEALRQAR